MKDIAGTLTRRIGSGIAAYLVAKVGIPEEAAQQIVIALGVTCGLVLDALVVQIIARLK